MAPSFLTIHLLPLVLLFYCGQVSASLTNLTIDDTDGTYWNFEGSWNAISPEAPCTSCTDKPDASQPFNGTWHQGGRRSGIFSFRGSAVYIYGIDTPAAFAGRIVFQLNNGSNTSTHLHLGSTYVYNSLFYSATGLNSSVTNTVNWVIEDGDGASSSDPSGLFDYARVTVGEEDVASSSSTGSSKCACIYRRSLTWCSSSATATPPPPPPAHNGNNAGPIAGAVVGVFWGIAIMGAVAVLLLRRRRRQQASTSSSDLESGTPPPPPPRFMQTPAIIIEPFRPPPRRISWQTDTSILSPGLSSASVAATSDPDSKWHQRLYSATETGTFSPMQSPETEARSNMTATDYEERLRNLERFAATFPPAYS
ncbi:hypothetical protein FB45DRAFT_766288 [Roridomyces roridus]|uniref:Uncharacterized protein n=1 Tax=Roridomyces roridus TaxID=1738132 RepID=A0AAD7F8X2_9AGAR|nr:hypothetical protein FB45DRAFT_766288 [Roridomyces roridus]